MPGPPYQPLRANGSAHIFSVVALCGLAALILVPFAIAVLNPLQSSRGAAYVVGGLSGVLALGMLLLQPVLAMGLLPGIKANRLRLWHRYSGAFLLVLVIAHIVGLYLTSPADMTDALLLVAPTPFSLYGVIALWTTVLLALLVATRTKFRKRLVWWSVIHALLAAVAVIATVVHGVMIDGTMGTFSKWILCACAVVAALAALARTVSRSNS